jgi:protein-tyrosine-phosphatase
MKRLLFVLAVVLVLSWPSFAQTRADDSPATKEDVERYLQAIHSRGMAAKMAVAMAQGTRQVLHEQYLKHKDDLPADYETKMNAKIDSMLAMGRDDGGHSSDISEAP